MTYVRAAAVTTLLLILWPLVTPAGPTYWRLLTAHTKLTIEATIGLLLVTTWLLRRLGDLLFLKASGRRLRASSPR